MTTKISRIALTGSIFTLLTLIHALVQAEDLSLLAEKSHASRGSVLSVSVGGAFPTQVEPVALPFVSLSYEYYLPVMRFTAGLRCTVATEGKHIVGNAMLTVGYILPMNIRTNLMLGYANYSQFRSEGRRDLGWAMDGFSWGLSAGWRW